MIAKEILFISSSNFLLSQPLDYFFNRAAKKPITKVKVLTIGQNVKNIINKKCPKPVKLLHKILKQKNTEKQ